jgi:hypothetical protein
MPHNIPLPTHKYVYVIPSFVRPETVAIEPLIPAVWWGVSVQPNRTLGCHVLLEDGAMVVDLPLNALRHDAELKPTSDEAEIVGATWDSYGWDAELFICDYLNEMPVSVLSETHQEVGEMGNLWFAVDHVKDGFSTYPAQHKHLWVVALNTGGFVWVPQDQLLLYDKSFTNVRGVPKVKRQDRSWSVE